MIGSLRKIWIFCKRQRHSLLFSLFLNLLRGGFSAMQLLGIIFLLDELAAGDVSTTNGIVRLAILTMVCVIGSYFTGYFEQIGILSADFHVVEDMRIHIGGLLRQAPLGVFGRDWQERIKAALTSGLAIVELSAAYCISGVIGGFLSTISILIMLSVYEWRTAFLIAFGMITYFLIIDWQMRVSRRHAPKQKEAMGRLVAAAITFAQGIRVTKAFSVQDGDRNMLDAIEKSSLANDRLTNVTMPAQFAGSLCIGVFEALVIILDLFLYLGLGVIDLEKTIVLLIVSFFVFVPMNQAGINLSMIGLLESAIDEINELENMQLLELVDPPEKTDSNTISLEQVSFSYGRNEVLHDLSVSIEEKTLTAIIGPSGSGKTTLCQLIARFWDADSGVIRIGGADIRHVAEAELMGKISMVFQRVFLFEDTIENNIRFGKPNATREDVVQAATAARCHEFISALPEGYDTRITEGGANLSGGEKQRISIARAILKDAPIVILDEATSALDAENEQAVLAAIGELTRNKTVIMIAHRLETVRMADKIIALEKGRIVQEGRHEELLCQDGPYKRFVESREEAGKWHVR